jgi:hypothetical protein
MEHAACTKERINFRKCWLRDSIGRDQDHLVDKVLWEDTTKMEHEK